MPAHRSPLETSSCKKIKVFIKIAKERTGTWAVDVQLISKRHRNRNISHGGMENTSPPEKLCSQ